MIPLHKLRALPRHQRLRKISNIFSFEDAALAQGCGRLPFSKLDYLSGVIKLLLEDSEFDMPKKEAFEAAASALVVSLNENAPLERMTINAVRHILDEAVGKQVADWDFIDSRGSLSGSDRKSIPGMRLFLEDVRSPFNVGSIFRAAESFGVERILLSPFSASPEHQRATRSSMGCVDAVPWERTELSTLETPVFALETGGTSMKDFSFPSKGILIVGSEELGVSPRALEAAGRSLGRVSIPTIGAKGSLNVAVAVGIVLCAWSDALLSGSAGSRS